jgi:hypothetical protein
VAVVTATRDGMNLVPYEYVVCRQGPAQAAAPGNGAAAAPPDKRHSMLVVSEFVGCSPSLSGAIRVNPWSIEAVRFGRGGQLDLCGRSLQPHLRVPPPLPPPTPGGGSLPTHLATPHPRLATLPCASSR